jgi:hypothetical protein
MTCNQFYCKDCPKRLNYPEECVITILKQQNALMLEALKKCHKHYVNLNNMFNGNCIHDSDYLENIINNLSGEQVR